MSEALQNYIWLQKLIDKVRHLSKECEITLEPIKKEQSVEEVASGLVSVIEDVVKFVIELRSIADQYSKLEEHLQKYQADIRKHIGVEHQLRLFGESIQLQLEESESIRFEFLQKTRLTIADLKRQNQKLHEQNMELKHRNDQAKQAGLSSRFDLRSKMVTQESSKERGSRSRLQTFEVDHKKAYRNDTQESAVRTPSKQNEYKLKIDKKDRLMQTNFHSERKKDIQRKVRQLVQNRNAKKTLFENSSYHQLYSRHKTIANHAHRRSLRKSIQSRDGRLATNENLQQDVVQQQLQS